MKIRESFPLLLEVIKYKIFRTTGLTKINPLILTFSVTASCQSRCKTCKIGQKYFDDPKRKNQDLSITEIEKVFKSMKPLYFFNISGGEPYLRDDLPDIVDLACKYLKPKIVHIPTNAIAVGKISYITEEILKIIKKYNNGIVLTVKPSIDGIEKQHDEIRGIKGNFNKLLDTINLLKDLEQENENFYLELGTVVSNYNINNLAEIEDFVHSLNVESYRNEIAEQRTEFFNIGDPITPSVELYEKLVDEFSQKIIKNIRNKNKFARTSEALRLVYYKLVIRILKEETQIIPCFAGISNVHINFNGGVWPCCVLGYDMEFGNLRDYGYDFQKVWHSSEAKNVRDYIKKKSCACPLANQAYSNILLDYKSMVEFIFKAILLRLK